MSKSLLLLSTVLSLNISGLIAANLSEDGGASAPIETAVVHPNEPNAQASVSATAADLAKIKAHVVGYGAKLGLPDTSKVVGEIGCTSWCSTTFNAAEHFLLNELAGQLLVRFLAIALDDLSDGKLDGIANGKKVSYAKEVASLLGVTVSEDELKSAPLDESLVVKLVGLGTEITRIILESEGQQDKLVHAAAAFAKTKMEKARKSLAVAMIHEADRIIALELGNGKIDGLDGQGITIDWKKEMKDSVEQALKRVLGGVL